MPTFAEHVTGVAYADDEAAGKSCLDKIPVAFERLERALEKQGAGPLFNGAKYSLVDAAYAPFLQRYFFLDRIRPIGQIAKYPRLKAWHRSRAPRAAHRAALSFREAQRCSGILKVKHVNSGVEVTSIVPPCALAISEAM